MSDSIDVKVWVRQGSMMVRADALPHTNPDSTYGQIKAMGLDPEDYRVYAYPDLHELSREQLMAEVSKLRDKIRSVEPYI